MKDRWINFWRGAGEVLEVCPPEMPSLRICFIRPRESIDRAWNEAGWFLTNAMREESAKLPESHGNRVRSLLQSADRRANGKPDAVYWTFNAGVDAIATDRRDGGTTRIIIQSK